MPRTVAVVPHTHWDREWYASFQAFRLRLVELIDDLLPRLEHDLSYARYLLDGQMAVVDDYLAVRPDAAPRIRALVGSGRLSIGPWYVLMDEFCVSGETIVRDLQLGLARAAEFGGAMPIGYLPDMFGHVAQMPQLLRQAGIEHAVVWRGVPAAIDKTAFWWEAPDGSRVRAEYLATSYSNGAAVPDDAKAFVRRIVAHEAEIGPFLDDGWPMLWMNGSDHQTPQPWLGRVVAEANDIQDDYRVVVTSLAEHVAAAPTTGLPSWTGELRSSARANLLMGVLSNRVDVKQAAARAERALERLAEPLSALFVPADQWPGPLLDLAWIEVVRNAAHDSSCACSSDVVVRAVLHRYEEATEIANGLIRRALRAAGQSMSSAGPFALNPTARPRRGLVELSADELVGPGTIQVVADATPSTFELTGHGRDLAVLLGRADHRAGASGHRFTRVELTERDDAIDVVVFVGRRAESADAVRSAVYDLYARCGARPDAPLRLTVNEVPSRRVLVFTDEIPGFGWAPAEPAELAPTRVAAGDDARSLDNGLVRVEIDPTDGTFSINGHAGFDRLVDDGDAGDTYNWSPPASDIVVTAPDAVSVAVAEPGPLRGRLVVTRTYRWPAEMVDGARVGEHEVEVVTTIELHAGDDLVRVETSFANRSRDHRVRTWFTLPEPVTSSVAECAFGVVERGLEAEGGPQEVGVPTFPSRRFVRAGSVTVVHEGLLEYEVVDSGRALALTLLRATGMLSADELVTRLAPAGPAVPAEDAEMQGRLTVRYGVHVGDADPYELADRAFVPLVVVEAVGGGSRPRRGSALDVDGAEVSALRRVDGGLEIRVFNPRPEAADVSFGDRSGWLVDLRGLPLEPFDGAFRLRPFGIATVRLDG